MPKIIKRKTGIKGKGHNNTSADYRRNAVMIQEAVLDYINNNKGRRMPTYQELANVTSLHVNTIKNHMADIDFKVEVKKFKCLNDKVMLNMFNLSKRNYGAGKAFLQFANDLSDNKNNSMQVIIQNINNLNFKELSDEQLDYIISGQFHKVLSGSGYAGAIEGTRGEGIEIEGSNNES